MFDDDIKDSGMDFANARMDGGDPWSRMPDTDRPKGKKAHKLDSEPMQNTHRRLLALYEGELDRQAENRVEMASDADFYDNIQWREEDARALKERGQMPLVYNVISTSINWVLGTEKRGRTDYKILPRRKDASKPAERKSQLLKYLSDVNRSPFSRSRAFEDSTKVGIGWLEAGVQHDDDGEPVVVRYESWRNILWDSACMEKDLSDARYVFRTKWVDLDIAQSMFPDRAGTLNAATSDDRAYGLDSQGDEAMDSQEDSLLSSSSTRTNALFYQRTRVRLIECWYRKPTDVDIIVGGDFSGEIFDKQNPAPGHQADLEERNAQVINRKAKMRVHVAIFCATGMLWHSESPYRHNQFPFTPIWCYRRDRDGLPYGMVRGMKDIQEDINKRYSKALHILSTNKTIMDEGAVDDLDEYAEEISRPDAIIVKKSGKELTINAERELAPAHMEMASRSIQMIQSLSGVTDENLGRKTNATSGVAIQSRQDQGSLATAGIFDNLRYAVQIHGEKELSLIEQYFTEEKAFRITNMRGTPEYITVNDGLPENDIQRSKADFVITEQDWRASVRQAQVEELLAFLQQVVPVAPQLALVTLDLIVESMDLPSREELVKRIRQVTGMRDPDAEELTPEEQQAEMQKQAAQQKQAELQERDALATIAVKEAKAQRDAIAAQKDQALIRQVLGALAGQNVQTQLNALQAAIQAISVPGAVPVADGLLHESGFMSRTEEEQIAAEQQQYAKAQQVLQEQQGAAQEQSAQRQQAMMQQQQPQQQPAEPVQPM